jgi:hypothetical protein
MNLFGHLNGGSAQRKASTYTGQHNTEKTRTHIHAPSRIRTCDPNVRAAEDSKCLRQRGHWDRFIIIIVVIIVVVVIIADKGKTDTPQ